MLTEEEMFPDHLDRVAEVLIEHTRTSIEKCHCGWSDLGASHAEHVARALDEVGLLASEEHDRAVRVKVLAEFTEEWATSWETGEVDYHRLVSPWRLADGAEGR